MSCSGSRRSVLTVRLRTTWKRYPVRRYLLVVAAILLRHEGLVVRAVVLGAGDLLRARNYDEDPRLPCVTLAHMRARVSARWMVLGFGLFLVVPAAIVEGQAAPTDERQEEARALFRAAQVAYDAGRFEAALERFSEAYTLSNRPQLLYNIGLAAERLGRRAEALAAYRAYLQLHPVATNREEVNGRVRSLEIALEADGTATVTEPSVEAPDVPSPSPYRPEDVARTDAQSETELRREGPELTTTSPPSRRRRVALGVGLGVGAAAIVAVVVGVVASRGRSGSSYQSDFGMRTDLR